MALFDSTSWTGRKSTAGGDVADAVTLPRPQIKSAKVEPKAMQPSRDSFIAEYADLAQLVGIAPPDLGIEAFKNFLRAQDWGIFPLGEVVAYMDKKAKEESKEQAGWQWRPLREKDHILNARLGVQAERGRDQYGHRSQQVERPASDLYVGPQEREIDELRYETVEIISSVNGQGMGHNQLGRPTGNRLRQAAPSPQHPYDKTIPLHALRKIAVIERDFKTAPVSFFVCDYATAPQIEHPDPFLMAAIDNPKLGIGIGRFIIDFWDEPGFGLVQMLK